MNKPILHLNLKRKWFDMVFSGEKKEEYREITPYWTRVLSARIRIKGQSYNPEDVTICFSNGYGKKRDQFYIECRGLRVGYGVPEWGAHKDKYYFCFKLGKIFTGGIA